MIPLSCLSFYIVRIIHASFHSKPDRPKPKRASLESKSAEEGSNGKTETSADTAASGNDNRRADDARSGTDETASADGNRGGAGDDGRSAVDGSSDAGADANGTSLGSLGGGGRNDRDRLGLGDERDAGGSRDDGNIISSAGEVNLGHGHGSVDDDGGAGAGNGRAGLVGAGNNRGKVDSDGGENGNNRGRGSSSGDIGGNAGYDARVGVDVGSADTLEEGDGIRDDRVRLAVGVDALVDVLDEEGVGAEAGSVGVVSAASLE